MMTDEIRIMAVRVQRQLAAEGLAAETLANVSWHISRLVALAAREGGVDGLKIAIDLLSGRLDESGGIDGKAELLALYERYYDVEAGVCDGDDDGAIIGGPGLVLAEKVVLADSPPAASGITSTSKILHEIFNRR
jgi:hypothetical protein